MNAQGDRSCTCTKKDERTRHLAVQASGVWNAAPRSPLRPCVPHSVSKLAGAPLCLAVTLALCGCLSGEAPLPPDQALQRAAQRIDAILGEDAAFAPASSVPEPPQSPEDSSKVTFWYCAHPILAPAFGPRERVAAYNAAHSGTLDAQFIGEWQYAIQKLTVSLAADDLPDVALVKRAWLARLAQSGRIVPLDALLPTALTNDLRPDIRDALSVDGQLFAFPADGFCSILFYNRNLLTTKPPATWEELRQLASAIQTPDGLEPDAFRPIGHIPFIESFLSAGGQLCTNRRSGLDAPQALAALNFLLSLRDDGLTHPRTQGHPESAFQLFLSGRLAMTVASSDRALRALQAPFPVGIAPVPGNDAPISLFSENAIVVFRKHAHPRRAAIAELLDFLTGPDVLGHEALRLGSLPVRQSVAASLDTPDGLAQASATLRWTPLIGPWGSIEFELNRYLSLAYRWEPQHQ